MAGGFSININNIETFKEFLIKKYNNLSIKNDNLKNLYLDSLILPTALNVEFYKNIEKSYLLLAQATLSQNL